MNRIEEILISSDPASDVFIESGFLVRTFTNDSLCSINRIVHNPSANYGEISKSIAGKITKKGINPSYRIVHDSSYEKLDKELVRHSYSIVEEGLVMALRIENMERELFTFANFYEQGIFTDVELSPTWLEDYKNLTNMDSFRAQVFENNIQKSMQEYMYLGLFERDRLIAMGYVSYLDGYVIIKDIFVDERYRNLDYGKRLLKAMLSKGLAKGCTVALCQIDSRQQVAGKMLSSEGFEGLYSYHYRAKNLTGE